VTVLELAEQVIRSSGAAVEPQVSGLFRVGDTRHILSDISKLRALGWEPTVGQAEIVEEYLAWASKEPDLRDTVTEAQARMSAAGVLRSSNPAGA
jgi:dTDP-L-rhamnose 4-epimerase